MDELSKTEIINGYEFFVPYNEIIARQIDYECDDYKIRHKTDCYCSEIYKLFGKEKNLRFNCIPFKKCLLYNNSIQSFESWKL